MSDFYIKEIHVVKVRNIKNLDIKLSDTERKHLILTGKNGSGKTSLLEAMRGLFGYFYRNLSSDTDIDSSWETPESARDYLFHIRVDFSGITNNYEAFKYLWAYIGANKGRIPDLRPPKQVEKAPSLSVVERFDSMVNERAMHYMNSLKLRAAYPKSAEEKETIERWFDNLQTALAEIYDNEKLSLSYDAEHLDFQILIPGFEPFSLNNMADGYSAFVSILFEIILRINDSNAVVDYNRQGVVLIDEIETHLHVELQKRVLPFLTKMFPNVQFIVATHSPFVITSLDNAVVFDLEKAVALQDLGQDTDGARLDSKDSPLTSYSYEDIVEGFYDISGYSATFEREFNRYKQLCRSSHLTDEENEERIKLKSKMSLIPASAKTLRYQVSQFEKEAQANGWN